MRIAFITFEYPPFVIGGAGVYAFNITQELAKLGHKVVVFTPDIATAHGEICNVDNLEIVKIKIKKNIPFKALKFWSSLPNEIKKAEVEQKFDVIHFNGISYHFLKKISDAPNIITVHHLVKDAIKNNKMNIFSRFINISGENSLLITFFEKKCVNFGNKLISVSNFTKRQLIDVYHLNPNQIEVIYNGIDFKGYDFTLNELNKIKKELNVDDKVILLFVGRINDPRKGLEFLLHSFKNICEIVDTVLIVVGSGNQENARKLSESIGISKNVFFAGYVGEDDLKKYYSLCDIYICPSKLEGFGLTILEAMVAGKPIVATKVGAIPEILEDGVNGILVDTGDSCGLSNAIHYLINNKSMQLTFGERNYEYVQNNFNWLNCAKSVERIYIEALLSDG